MSKASRSQITPLGCQKDPIKFFPSGRKPRSNALCTNCLSLERHRLIFLCLEKETTIYADEITYFKNDEKVFTTGNSKAINENNTITASSLEYDKINNIFKIRFF